MYWWGSSTPQTNGDNESLVQLDGDTATPSGRLWAFANFSRFIRPGAVRVAATAADNGLTIAAFRNAGKSVTVVALNTRTAAAPVTVTLRSTGNPERCGGNSLPDQFLGQGGGAAPDARVRRRLHRDGPGQVAGDVPDSPGLSP